MNAYTRLVAERELGSEILHILSKEREKGDIEAWMETHYATGTENTEDVRVFSREVNEGRIVLVEVQQ